MSTVIVNVVGVGLISLIVWYFWMSKPSGTSAGIRSGTQEAYIVVKGGYSPDTIRVKAGMPVKLMFNRQEADPCSETVVFDAFGISAELPEEETVAVEFTPTEAGNFEFSCQMGMLRGTVVVT
ncbi:MAG: cupredoxin domain-containing protein [Acidimicrobiia bacterium]|jgi:plastocyanin domain-containing protein|nr:cupredoxin domain-containing protein [Acidimicrobiia bacterium]NNF64758.1 cupredoxin domain-containing protein [Acidimicrobiia bacterium]